MFQPFSLLMLLRLSLGLLIRLRRTCGSTTIVGLGTLPLVPSSYELPKNWL